MVNKVTLIGRLGKDPEIRTLDNGTYVAKFSLATDESYKDRNGEWQTQTEWHNVIMWRDMAERAERMLKKGSLVYIDGKLTSRSWQDQNGQTRYITEIRANTFRALSSNEATREKAVASQPVAAPVAQPTNTDDGDLPF